MKLYPVAFLTLLGCVAPQPVIQTVTVKVPVSVPCLKVMPTKPDILPLDQVLALSDYEATIRLAQDHLKSLDYQQQIDAILPACVQP